ncbi:MAG: hypothetical protein Q7R92_04970, partial [bacterium]|nr:hypothetical protein [bacterium]
KKKLIPPSKQKITYSPESIKISFVLGENLFNSLQMQNPAPEVRGGAEFSPENFSALRQKNNNEFVSLSNAPGVGFEPTTNWLHLSLSFLKGWTISSSVKEARRFRRKYLRSTPMKG